MAGKKTGSASSKKNGKAPPVEAVKHKDSRINIPTREQGAMVAEEEATPKALLYLTCPRFMVQAL